jgi:epoxyqueuosine reductase
MARRKLDLRALLNDACTRRGAVAFGIASVDEADALETIKVGSIVNRWSVKIRESMPEAKTVVVFAIKSVDDADEIAIWRGEKSWDYPGYNPLLGMRREVIKILRESGYRAAPAHWLVPLKRLAILAGIGAYAKNSMVLSPKHGLWLRLEAVVTDAELPIDKPFAKDLCGRCTRCVRACPTKAIKPYVLTPERCLIDVSERDNPPKELERIRRKIEVQLTPNAHVMCTVCQKVCPYTSPERRRNQLLVRPAKR